MTMSRARGGRKSGKLPIDGEPDAALGPDGNTAGVSGAGLMRVIEREIIPRLFLAHRSANAAGERSLGAAAREDESAAFADFVLASDATQIRLWLEALFDRGIRLERIYLDLVAPAARHLQAFGDQDRYDADAVWRGLARLRQVLGEILPEPDHAGEHTGDPGSGRAH